MSTRKESHDEATALCRYLVVSQVCALVAGGMGITGAIDEVADRVHFDSNGRLRRFSSRSLWRWHSAWICEGNTGLLPKPRPQSGETVLPAELVDLIGQLKREHEAISIPEILRRAAVAGIIDQVTDVDRVTVWRFCRRRGLPTARRRKSRHSLQRPWRYPSRMQCVLADGKHFRAGSGRAKRVAIVFLDDATRFVLGVVVGTAEPSDLILRGLRKVIDRWGLMDILYVDLGPGFDCNDLARVCSGRRSQGPSSLRISLILGSRRYPEARGAIERFNRTLEEQLLVSWPGNPGIDPDILALERRIEHWTSEVYNRSPHEGLGGKTPEKIFHDDDRKLVYPASTTALNEAFVTSFARTVTPHNCVSIDSTLYEMPLGYRGQEVEILRHMIDGHLFFQHQGRRLRLQPADLAKNARERRRPSSDEEPATTAPSTAADLAFDRDNPPMTDSDGNYRGEDS